MSAPASSWYHMDLQDPVLDECLWVSPDWQRNFHPGGEGNLETVCHSVSGWMDSVPISYCPEFRAKRGILLSQSKAKRFEEFCLEYEKTPDASAPELAQRLGMSQKGIQRYKKLYQQLMRGEDFSGLVNLHERAAQLLLWISRRRGLVPMEEVQCFVSDEFGLGEGMARRIVQVLEERGYVVRSNGGYMVGNSMLPDVPLSEEEWDYVARYLDIMGRRGPLAANLESVLTKLRLGMAVGSVSHVVERARKRHNRMLVKGPHGSDKRSMTRAEELVHASATGQRLTIAYRPFRAADALYLRVLPLGVVFNGHSDEWYLVAMNQDNYREEHYRFDRMTNIEGYGGTGEAIPMGLPEHFRHAWGIENGPLHEVRVLFHDDFNVHDKVRQDAAGRASVRLTRNPDGTLLFEDKVAGLGEFCHWLRQFGASAVPLDPPELCAVIRQGAERKLKRYGVDP